jgi:uncharacterized Zn-binding protein involved in type VI secretion
LKKTKFKSLMDAAGAYNWVMSKPAARVSDMHVCPQVTPGTPPVPHVGGPVIIGSLNVLIGGLPAARVTDLCTCVGPPDTISVGSLGVTVNNLCAARVGDMTVHGGAITIGCPTVLIGEIGNAVAGIAQGINPSGSVINCGYNVDAAIARIYGTDPNATSPPNQDGLFTEIGNRHGTTINWGHTLNDAFDAVRAGGHGTTAIVGIDYGNGSSHVVVMTNHYGTPVIVEGQDWGAGQPAEAITSPAAAQGRYSPADVGIGVLPNRAP